MAETIFKNPSCWNKRSILEKSLIITLLLIILTALILAIGIILLTLKFQAAVCMTPGCLEAAAHILKQMNQSVDPCDNFYEFACGNYKNVVEIPGSESNINALSLIGTKISEQVKRAIEEPIKSTEPKSLVLGKKFYSSCTNEVNIEKQGLSPIKKVFSDLGGWPILEENWKEDNFDWKQFNYKLKNKGLPFAHLMNLYISTDAKNPKQRVLHLFQASLDLPKDYLDQDIEGKLLSAYFQYMIDVAIIFGANETFAREELMDAFLFQRNLSEISLSQIELRNASSLYNPMTIEELQNLHPFVPWLEYINNILHPAIQVNSTEIIINEAPSYFTELEDLLEKTPSRTIVNHIFWTIVRNSIISLPKEVQNAEFKFLSSAAGIPDTIPRWKRCVKYTKKYFDLVIGSLYVRKYFNIESKKITTKIVDDIRDVFEGILMKNEWMEEKTKQSAIDKLKAMDRHIAYPDELLDDKKLDDCYQNVTIVEDSFLDSTLTMNIFWTNYVFKQLREPVNKTDWKEHGDTAINGAFYTLTENSISIPAGILQGNFFSSSRPNYMNYGAIGFIVGHEITHGFDNEGRQYDKEGTIKNWWDTNTEMAFLEKSQCIIDQYSNYTINEINQNINGELTEGENIADNGGMKEAYFAYQKFVLRNGKQENQLPGLPFTPYQMFWISMASVWCSSDRPEHLKLLINKDEHSPNIYRVIGALSNRLEFAKDFNCPAKSKMNPSSKCQVW